jgi:hypothetical protein
MCIPYKKLESKNLNGLGWNRNASYFFSTWMELGWRLTHQKTESKLFGFPIFSNEFENPMTVTSEMSCTLN